MSDAARANAQLAAHVVGALALVALAVGYAVREESETGPPPAEVHADADVTRALAQLRADLARLEERVARVADGAPPVVPVPAAAAADDVPERAPVAGTIADASSIAEQLAALRREIKAAAALLAPQSAQMAEASARPTNWAQVEAFRQQYAQDRERARQEMLVSSQAQVLARFGKPTQFGNGATTWYYGRFIEGKHKVLVWFDFVDGIVTSASANTDLD